MGFVRHRKGLTPRVVIALVTMIVGLVVALILLVPRISNQERDSGAGRTRAARGTAPATKSQPVPSNKRGGFGIMGMPSAEELRKWMSPEDLKLLEKATWKGDTKFFRWGDDGPIVLVYLDGVQIHPDPDELFGKTPKISTDDSLSPTMKKQIIERVFAELEKRGLTAEQASQALVEELYDQAKASLQSVDSTSTPGSR